MLGNTAKKLNAIIYTRVSSSKQVDNESLDVQDQACRRYAESIGAKVIKLFREEGESAKFADRTQLINLLEYCRRNKGKVDILIVWKIDRFARNQTDHFAIRAKLMESGVTLHSATEPLSDDPVGKAMEGMLAVFAEFDNSVRSQRATENMKSAFKSGRWMWVAPLGYKNNRLSNGYSDLECDEDRFGLIKSGLNEFVKGTMLLTDLTRYFNDRNLKNMQGNPVSRQLTARILDDKFYAGIMFSRKWNLEARGNYEPMITIDTYDKIQAIRRKENPFSTVPHHARNESFPLRGDLYCFDCKKALTASFSKGRSMKYGYYSCQNKQCTSVYKTFKSNSLHGEFNEYLNIITPTEKALESFKENVLKVWKEEYSTAQQVNVSIEKQLKDLEKEKDSIYQLAKKGIIPDDIIQKDMAKVESRILGVRTQLNEVSIDENQLGTVIDTAIQFMKQPALAWKKATLDNKQRMQQMIFPEGLIYQRDVGFGTSTLALPFELARQSVSSNYSMVHPEGLEPPTSASATLRSIL